MSTTSQIPALLSVETIETDRVFMITMDLSDSHINEAAVSMCAGALVVDMFSRHAEGQSYYLGEMPAERYQRTIPIGFEVAQNAISKNYQNGILTIRIPKPAREEKSVNAKAATTA